MTSRSNLRQFARTLFDAAVDAADPSRALRRAFGSTPLPRVSGTTHLIAIGKAAPAMMGEALRHVNGAHTALVVTHHQNDADCPGAEVLRADHPVPDAAGLAAGERVLARLAEARPDDVVVALISGGGSALVPAPAGDMTLEDKQAVNALLLGAGLDITAMNLVRQNLSRLKGGGLLRAAAPAKVVSYILSDVIGDDLRAVASGPSVGPLGPRSAARNLLKAEGLWNRLPESARQVLDGADEPRVEADTPPTLIASNRQSVEAMADAARAAGWDAVIGSDRLEGDVANAAAEVVGHISVLARPTAVLFGGETTVVLRGDGRGGRNQELALRVALTAPEGDWIFLSGGTDGRDGPTDAAGGIVDASTKHRSAQATALLENNDSYRALKDADDLLVTPATGTNVADVQVLLLPGPSA